MSETKNEFHARRFAYKFINMSFKNDGLKIKFNIWEHRNHSIFKKQITKQIEFEIGLSFSFENRKKNKVMTAILSTAAEACVLNKCFS